MRAPSVAALWPGARHAIFPKGAALTEAHGARGLVPDTA